MEQTGHGFFEALNHKLHRYIRCVRIFFCRHSYPGSRVLFQQYVRQLPQHSVTNDSDSKVSAVVDDFAGFMLATASQAWSSLEDPFTEVRKDHFAGSVRRKSIPAASSATSTEATDFNAVRSIISTVPGSEPIPSTETNA